MFLGTEFKAPETKCLRCGTINDAGFGVTDDPTRSVMMRPHEGDVVICAYCAHPQCYGKDLQYRELTIFERMQLASNYNFNYALAAVRARVRERKEKSH